MDDGKGEKDEVYHGLEARFISLQQEHEKVKGEKESLQKRLTELTETSTQDKTVIVELRAAVGTRDAALAEQQRLSEHKDHEIKRLTELLARTNKELDNVKEYVQSKDETVTKLEATIRELNAKRTELETEQLPMRVEVNRLKKELETTKRTLDDSDKELSLKIQELQDERKKASSGRVELQGKVTRAEDTIAELQQKVQRLESDLRSRTNSLERKDDDLLAAQKHLTEVEQRFDAELAAQRNLTGLYEKASKDAEERVQTLLKEVQSLKETCENQLMQHKDRLQSQREIYEKALDDLERSHQEQIENLESELRTEKEANEKLQKAKSNASSLPQSAAAQAFASLPQDLNLTERLSQMAELETQLLEEKSEKERYKFFASQLAREIEEKAPILAKERREKDLIAKSYDKVVAQLDKLAKEYDKNQRTLQAIAQEREELIAKQRGHDQLVNDLSRQIQLLLHSNMQQAASRASMTGGPSSASRALALPPSQASQALTVTGESLVTFRDIQELQIKNRELLAVVRKMNNERAQREEALEGGQALIPATIEGELIKAHKELENLSEDRKAMQAALTALASDRDMYRHLLFQAETQLSQAKKQRTHGPGAAAGTAAEAKSAAPAVPQVTRDTAKELELEAKARDLEARLNSLQESYKEQIRTSEKLRDDLSSSRQEAGISKADSVFYKERYDRLKEDQERLKQDYHQSIAQVATVRGENNGLEKTISDKNHELDAARDEVRRLQISISTLTVEKEVAVGAEKRFEQEVQQKFAEVQRLTTLLETSQSISTSLTERNDKEREHLDNERKLLQNQLVAAKKEVNELRAVSEDRINTLTNELKVAKAKHEQDAKELNDRQTQNHELKTSLNAAEGKVTSLTKQVDTLQKRIDSYSTSGTMQAAAIREATEKEVEIERLKRELDEAKNKLAVIEKQKETFKAASDSHEKNMQELKTRWEKAEAEHTKAVKDMQADLEGLRKRSEETTTQLRNLLQENHQLKDEQSKQAAATRKELQDAETKMEALCKTAEKVQTREAELRAEAKMEALRETAENLQTREAELKAEAKRAKDAEATASEQYRRELQLHAAAQSQVADLKGEIEALKVAKNEVDDRLTAVNADMLAKELTYNNEKQGLEEAAKKEKQRADELTEQNKLMHSNLQALAVQMERLQNERMRASQTAAVEGTGGEAAVDRSELDRLRQVVIDLQGVASYHRNQKELLEATKQSAELEAVRLRTQLTNLQKSLDQVRSELAEERKKTPSAASEREHAALIQQVQELNTVKDAIAHLRQEKDKTDKRLREREMEIEKMRADAGPTEQKLQQLLLEKKNLEIERESLNKEVRSYSDRIANMVTSFHQIDPEVHRKLNEDHNKLKEALGKSSKESEASKKRIAELEAKIIEIEQREGRSKNQALAGKRAADKLTKEKEALEVQLAEVKRLQDATTPQITQLTKENNDLQAELSRLRSGNQQQHGQLAKEKADLSAEVQRLRPLSAEITKLRNAEAQALAQLKTEQENVARLKAEAGEKDKTIAKLQEVAKGARQKITAFGNAVLIISLQFNKLKTAFQTHLQELNDYRVKEQKQAIPAPPEMTLSQEARDAIQQAQQQQQQQPRTTAAGGSTTTPGTGGGGGGGAGRGVGGAPTPSGRPQVTRLLATSSTAATTTTTAATITTTSAAAGGGGQATTTLTRAPSTVSAGTRGGATQRGGRTVVRRGTGGRGAATPRGAASPTATQSPPATVGSPAAPSPPQQATPATGSAAAPPTPMDTSAATPARGPPPATIPPGGQQQPRPTGGTTSVAQQLPRGAPRGPGTAPALPQGNKRSLPLEAVPRGKVPAADAATVKKPRTTPATGAAGTTPAVRPSGPPATQQQQARPPTQQHQRPPQTTPSTAATPMTIASPVIAPAPASQARPPAQASARPPAITTGQTVASSPSQQAAAGGAKPTATTTVPGAGSGDLSSPQAKAAAPSFTAATSTATTTSTNPPFGVTQPRSSMSANASPFAPAARGPTFGTGTAQPNGAAQPKVGGAPSFGSSFGLAKTTGASSTSSSSPFASAFAKSSGPPSFGTSLATSTTPQSGQQQHQGTPALPSIFNLPASTLPVPSSTPLTTSSLQSAGFGSSSAPGASPFGTSTFASGAGGTGFGRPPTTSMFGAPSTTTIMTITTQATPTPSFGSPSASASASTTITVTSPSAAATAPGSAGGQQSEEERKRELRAQRFANKGQAAAAQGPPQGSDSGGGASAEASPMDTTGGGGSESTDPTKNEGGDRANAGDQQG